MKDLDYPEDFPQKNKKRGERKAKFASIKKVSLEEAKNVFHISDEFIVPFATAYAEHGLSCGCWMCQNPRKTFKGKKKSELTIQELKQKEAAEQAIAEIADSDTED